MHSAFVVVTSLVAGWFAQAPTCLLSEDTDINKLPEAGREVQKEAFCTDVWRVLRYLRLWLHGLFGQRACDMQAWRCAGQLGRHATQGCTG